MSGPGKGVDEAATSGTMWYASRYEKWQQIPTRPTYEIDTIGDDIIDTRNTDGVGEVIPLLRGDPSSLFHVA